MKGIYVRLAGRLAAVLGLLLLTLSAAGPALAAPAAGDLPEGMAGVTWQLESMQTPSSGISHPMQQGIIVTIVFDGNGNLNGTGACNNYFAGYTAGANSAITIGPIGATQKACAENLMNLDQSYFATLQNAVKYSLFQGHLSLANADGTGILNYISSTPPTGPGMPITGNGTLPWPAWFGLALGLYLAALGVMLSFRRPAFRAVRIRSEDRRPER